MRLGAWGASRRRLALGLAAGLIAALASAWLLLGPRGRPAVRPPKETDPLAEELRSALAAGAPEAKLFQLGNRWLRAREAALAGRDEELFQALDGLASEAADRCPTVQGACRLAEALWTRALAVAGGRSHASRADVLSSLAWLDYRQGRWPAAERRDRQVVALRRESGDRAALANALLDLANNLFHQGRYGEAGALADEALANHAPVGEADPLDLADTFVTLGELRRIRGEYADAETAFQKALQHASRAAEPDELLRAKILNLLGALAQDQGDYFAAESRYVESLRLRERSPQSGLRDLATARLNLGSLYRIQGDYPRAEAHYRRAVAEAERGFGARHSELVWFYDQLAQLYQDRGLYAQAKPVYEKALDLSLRSQPANPALVARGRHQLAHLLVELGSLRQAENLYRLALASREEIFGGEHSEVAVTLTGLADCLLRDRPPAAAAARGALDRALAIFARTPAYPEIEAEALALRARLQRGRGDRAAAVEDLARSLDVVEALRPRLSGGEASRIHFLGRFLDEYELMIQWQIEDRRLDRAVEYAERSRARALVDRLLGARVDLRRHVPRERLRALERREVAAKQRLAEVQRAILLRESDLGAAPTRRQGLEPLYRQLAEADRDLVQVEEDILGASSLWREIAGRSPASLETIQQRLAPPDGALLLYAVGDERSHLFVLPRAPAAAAVFGLEIDTAAAAALGVAPGALGREAVRGILFGGEGRPAGIVSLLRTRPDGGGTADLPARLHALWRTLVPRAAWEAVRRQQEVVVVPGGLHALPFEALVVAGPRPGAPPGYWLDSGGPLLRYASSATALERMAAALADPFEQGRSTILSVSDPLFPRSTDRLRGRRSVPAFGLLSRLPGSGEETRALREVFGPAERGGEVVALQRERATELAVRRAVPGKRYIHIGTHGMVDERRNALFASLLLTPPKSPRSGSDDDGFLQLFELYALEVDADLVVLSACSTHVGPHLEGEGAFALSRAFSVAGARRVVASLWPVEDRATAALMRSFFNQVGAAESAGRRPHYAAYLAQAKRLLRAEPESSSPYFWAPFVLHGNG
ncbi:MAG TPA: CHAT domain-containing tetratricopeptide repeat protein [Thermoanaerobaculia bacterium]|nr:CHAT domain-containing tetratricopeptide repeat protein [Thermoanaerobaculia bacterium]